MKSFLLFTTVRILIFLASFALLYLLLPSSVPWIYSGILAAVVAMLISILFLARPRQALAEDLQEQIKDYKAKRGQKISAAEADALAEDSYLELESDAQPAAQQNQDSSK